MHYVWAIAGAWTQQWSEMATTFKDPLFYIRDIPQIAVLAWIITQGNDAVVATYVVVGVVLLTTSNRSLFQMGWSLSSELFGGTLQHVVLSRTPMALVLFGKAAAAASSAFFSGLIALLVAWWLARDLIEVADPALLAVSVCVAIVAIIATGFIWAPLFVLVGTRPGFFNAITPFAVVFGGFIVPIDLLSPTGEAVARLLPTAWTSEAIYYSIRDGSPEAGRILANLGVALAIAVLYFAVTWALFRFVERRIRISATLDLG